MCIFNRSSVFLSAVAYGGRAVIREILTESVHHARHHAASGLMERRTGPRLQAPGQLRKQMTRSTGKECSAGRGAWEGQKGDYGLTIYPRKARELRYCYLNGKRCQSLWEGVET